MRASPKRKTPPIDSASIELVTSETNGLGEGDTASLSDNRYRADGVRPSEAFISRRSSLYSDQEVDYLTTNNLLPGHRTNYANFNISAASLPRHSSEVTKVGNIAEKTLSYQKAPSIFDNSMSANLTQSDSAVDEKGLPAMPEAPNKSSLRNARNRRKGIIIASSVLAAIVVIVLVVALPVTLTRKNNNNSSQADEPVRNHEGNLIQTSGGDGSEVTLDDGNTFTYNNAFGGHWNSLPGNTDAQSQSYTPPLSEKWDFNNDKILGVNLGGWLVLEPFIVPGLYEECENIDEPCVDELTLSNYYRSQGKLEEVLEEHYSTFITEKDFADIAAAGLNWIRLPIPFWMIETIDGEPFYEGGAFKYFENAVKWARKYGLRINLDLHTVPGSQNGFNHSGKLGEIHWMSSPMGVVNAQRTLNYIRAITELISDDDYKDVVQMLSVINEPFGPTIGKASVASFYFEAYKMIRDITGIGEGNGPWIAFHDAFLGGQTWNDFLRGADRVALDTHPYVAFNGQNQDPMDEQVWKPCAAWGESTNNTMADYGVTFAGEFSLAINDCGTVNGVNDGTRYEGTYIDKDGNRPEPGFGEGACDRFNDWQNWDDEFKSQLKGFGLSSMDSLQNYFFWTWKIGDSSRTHAPINPFWSYQLGLKEGYITESPHTEPSGTCEMYSKQGDDRQWVTNDAPATFPDWMLGKEGAGVLFGDQSEYQDFPPNSLNNINEQDMQNIPTYEKNGPRIQLHPLPFTYIDENGEQQSVEGSDGWFNDDDNSPFYSPKEDCDRYRSPYYDGDMIPGTC
ncbi:glycoside hydrolase [Wallemia mellicola]|uniref:glucan 1,3-beta-glucosidase n=1 Tax=Wallemia mellicola TaxID=1708541 RepID=A0A4T0Q296_9BASI|nr:glycoside hydrolase [Wallemia mellicola]TIC16267.1 glycoside hydrolase [Wallemia mellicola]TIC32519.1 glycoside hydrolase [Wallemia mellicola]TIC58525.1 glycoside hydrolase [Wallemia mellicola]